MRLSTFVRSLVNRDHTRMPVVIIIGSDQPPRIAGESYYWTTPSGKTRVHYPNAYGYPTLYHASTRRIEVGSGYLATLEKPALSGWGDVIAQVAE